MDSVDSAESRKTRKSPAVKYYLQLGLSPSTSASPASMLRLSQLPICLFVWWHTHTARNGDQERDRKANGLLYFMQILRNLHKGRNYTKRFDKICWFDLVFLQVVWKYWKLQNCSHYTGKGSGTGHHWVSYTFFCSRSRYHSQFRAVCLSHETFRSSYSHVRSSYSHALLILRFS